MAMHERELKPLLIRADGNAAIGTGHIMRCFALAHAWLQEGGGAAFASATLTPSLAKRLRKEGCDVVEVAVEPGSENDAHHTATLARRLGAGWVVADGYRFGSAYQRQLKEEALKLLVLDDYGHAEHYFADIVLNQNIHADGALYPNCEASTRLLLGTSYALLRRQFDAWRGWKREIPPVARKVLVTLGGADPDNVTGKVIEALAGLDVDAKIIVGGSNPHWEGLRAEAGNLKEIELIVDAVDMPDLMAWADVAVAAGGTTSWELAFMGLPSLVLVLADNQVGIAAALGQRRVAQNLGWHHGTTRSSLQTALLNLLYSAARRGQMSQRGRKLVDGQGAERVVAEIRRLS